MDESTLPSVREILGLSPKPIVLKPDTLQMPSQDSVEPPPPTQATANTEAFFALNGAGVPPLDLMQARVPTPPIVKPASKASRESGSDSEEEEDKPRPFSLARYAYVPPSRTPSLARMASSSLASRSASLASVAASRHASTSTSPIDVVPPMGIPAPVPPRKKRGRKPPLDLPFSEAELARLLKCPGCNLAWTVRKTGAQKVKHVQACARKNSLTDATLEALMREEIARNPGVHPRGKGKGKEKAAEPEPEPDTMLGEIIREGEAKKKRRRRVPVELTVRELKDTREDILARARMLLATQTTKDTDTRGDGDIGEVAATPPLTQPFGESALANRFKPARNLVDIGLTQVYVPSPSQAYVPLPDSDTGFAPLSRQPPSGPSSEEAGTPRLTSDQETSIALALGYEPCVSPEPRVMDLPEVQELEFGLDNHTGWPDPRDVESTGASPSSKGSVSSLCIPPMGYGLIV